MSLLSPAFLLAAVFLCAASSTPIPANAHDISNDTVLLSSQTVQQRHMTSSLLEKFPYAANTVSTSQQTNLGRNLLNLERQHQQQKQKQQHTHQYEQNAKGNEDNDDKDSFVVVRSLPSVVENWSLVCKQLCGASLGGEPCAAACAAASDDRNLNATRSQNAHHAKFEDRRAAICVDLCEVGLGGKTCGCGTGKSPTKNFDIVCRSFCEHAGTTLKGCSPCNEKSLFEGNDHFAETTSKAANNLTYMQAVEPIAATTATTTTPDWDELCASLCKTGDGGSLCNCDLSPFFK